MFANSFPPDAEMARLTARMLLDIRAVHFRRDEPYRLTSGLASPVYIDCRKLISYPRVRAALMDFACAKLLRDAGFARFDAVAGGETAGIPFAAWISERMGLPMLYVRKKPKGFGRDAQIEGAIAEGARVLLVEDLTTDGGSKLRFAEALRAAGPRSPTPSSSSSTTSSRRPCRRSPATASRSTTSPPGATSWPRHAPASIRRGDPRRGGGVPRRAARLVGGARRRHRGRRVAGARCPARPAPLRAGAHKLQLGGTRNVCSGPEAVTGPDVGLCPHRQ